MRQQSEDIMSEQVNNLREQSAGASENEMATKPHLHDRITEAYYGKMGDEFARSTRDRVHWICSVVNGKRVLDVGCSQGIAAVLLGREGKTVIGIDVMERSVEQAREYLAQEAISVQEQVNFIHGGFLTADLGTHGFDTVIMTEVLEHLTHPEAFISAAAKRLGKNGRLIVTVPFGVNDFLDHKKTFYFGEPWRLIIKNFNIDEVKLFGKWIGFVATLRTGEETLTSVLSLEDVVAQTEAAFQEIERHLLKRVNTLAKEASEIRANLRAMVEQNAALKTSAAESEATRAGLVQALTELKERSQRTENTLEVLRTEMRATEARISAEKTRLSRENASLEVQLEEQKRKISNINEALRDSKAAYDAVQVEILELKFVASEKDKEISRLVAELSASERWAKHHEIEAQKKSLALEAERTAHLESEKQRLLTEYRAEEMASRLVNHETELEHAKQNLRERTKEVAFLQSRLEQLRAEQEDKEEELTRLSEEIDASKARELALREETEALRGLVEKESRAAETQEEKRIEADARASALNDHLAAKQAEISALWSAFEQQDAELNEQKERFSWDLITAEETALLWLEELERQSSALSEAQKQITALEGALDTREEDYRAEKQDLFDKLEASRKDAAMLQTMIDTAEKEKRRLAVHAAAMEEKKVLADERADRQRKTLSFRLGNTLIFGFKSWKGLRRLPFDLIKLKREWTNYQREENRTLPRLVGENSSKKTCEPRENTSSYWQFDDILEDCGLLKDVSLDQRNPIWCRIAVVSGQELIIEANLECSDINGGGDRKAVLLFNAFDAVGGLVDKPMGNLAKSSHFKAYFKYLPCTQNKLQKLHNFIVPEGIGEIRLGVCGFNQRDDEQVVLRELRATPKPDMSQTTQFLPPRALVTKQQLTKTPHWSRFLVDELLPHSVMAMLDVEGAENRHAKSIIVRVVYYDKDQEEIQPPYSGLLLSKTVGAFSYINAEGDRLVQLIPPRGAVEAAIGLQHWNAKGAVWLTSAVACKAEMHPKEVSSRSIIKLGDKPEVPARLLANIKVAAILDEFTMECFRMEVDLTRITPDNWERQIEEAQPDLLFVESCWFGNGNTWGGLMYGFTSNGPNRTDDLLKVIGYCRKKDIPTVFWAKEDPIHFSRFGPTAKLFDYVYTTDANMVPEYRKAYGIDAEPLSFFCQPRIHNPVPWIIRNDKTAFAGSYYSDKIERCEDFHTIIQGLAEAGVDYDIYDRCLKRGVENLQFPEHFKKHVVGHLEPHEMWKAYKGYRYTVNLNTVKHSPTMFARRVYESLASGTPVISNYSEGVITQFGGIVCASDRQQDIVAYVEHLRDPEVYAAVSSQGVRETLGRHTLADRLEKVCEQLGLPVVPHLPLANAIYTAGSDQEVELARAHFQMQSYHRKRLVINLENSNVLYPYLNRNSEEEVFRVLTEFAKPLDGIEVHMNLKQKYPATHLEDAAIKTQYACGQLVDQLR
jgi:SAM-dependent methyltransferase